ncbi:hypothetical protein O3297_07305 [Janthinobacterium sp. SUN128]|uniref:hypothetical protein n=1 Tax=Janthinobacterium sp. SUN128 TaxID=3014790 RepID=UPI002712432A|nr:hypothetical protein [Janthinobacterium sp. SUN128]MDO8033216.1 hypothetical protein [Janthinobacterium sp. SUN128]
MTLDEEKQIAEIKKLRIERLKTISGLCAGLSSTFGLVAVFIYCFFVIGFFPSGLSVGDTLFFIFVMLAFSCIGALSVIVGFLPFVPWATQKILPSGKLKSTAYLLGLWLLSLLLVMVFFEALNNGAGPASGCQFVVLSIVAVVLIGVYWYLARKLTEDGWFAVAYVMPLIASTSMLGYIAALNKPDAGSGVFNFLAIPLVLLFSGMFLSLGVAMFSTSVPLPPPIPPVPPVPPGPATANLSASSRGAFASIAVGILFAYIPLLAGQHSFNYVMSGLGLRSDAVLIVNKTNFATMQAAADAKGVLLHSCKMDGDSFSISNVRVLWHGVGLRSYIELKGTDAVDTTDTRIELDSAGVKVSRGGKETVCQELKNGIYFSSGKETFEEGQWAISKSYVDKFMPQAKKGEEKKVVIVGFADPMPREKEGNFVLAHKRACTVFHQLLRDKSISEADALIDIRLDRDGISGCGEMKESLKQRACFEQGRRVELQVLTGAGKVSRAGTADAKTACGAPAH